MELNKKLDHYLGNKNQYSENDLGGGNKEVCDLLTGDCYIVREKDGLIERAGHQTVTNRQVKVETARGIKQLLKD